MALSKEDARYAEVAGRLLARPKWCCPCPPDQCNGSPPVGYWCRVDKQLSPEQPREGEKL